MPTYLVQLFGQLLLLVQLPGERVAQRLRLRLRLWLPVAGVAAHLLPEDGVPFVLLLQLRPGGLQPADVRVQLRHVALYDRRFGGERGLQAVVGLQSEYGIAVIITAHSRSFRYG